MFGTFVDDFGYPAGSFWSSGGYLGTVWVQRLMRMWSHEDQDVYNGIYYCIYIKTKTRKNKYIYIYILYIIDTHEETDCPRAVWRHGLSVQFR